MSDVRVGIRKTYKLYIGGAFVRSESGRTDIVSGVNVPRGSRKDARDAIKAARGAAGGWAGRTAYNRGQVLYRAAEALESRASEFDAAEVGEAVDTLVHYAGWTDKLHAVLGTVNPVAAPFLSMSTPEATGVVAVLHGSSASLPALVESIAAPLAAGNVVVVALPESDPLPGLDLGEVLGVSDIPSGVVNLISGRLSELLPALASHRDVNAIIDATDSTSAAAEIDTFASETLKRVLRNESDPLARLSALTEIRTVWHPIGA
jgi:acyl-CoA reductase-like NAD-dependent aldehyde dehydrogenase